MLLNYPSIRSRSRKKDKFFQIQVIVSISQADIITLAALNKECLVSFLYPISELKHAKAKLKGPCGKQILYSHRHQIYDDSPLRSCNEFYRTQNVHSMPCHARHLLTRQCLYSH